MPKHADRKSLARQIAEREGIKYTAALRRLDDSGMDADNGLSFKPIDAIEDRIDPNCSECHGTGRITLGQEITDPEEWEPGTLAPQEVGCVKCAETFTLRPADGIVLGVDPDTGADVVWNTAEQQHLRVYGLAGSGTTVLIMQALLDAPSDARRIYLDACKKVEGKAYLSGSGVEVITEVDEAVTVLSEIDGSDEVFIGVDLVLYLTEDSPTEPEAIREQRSRLVDQLSRVSALPGVHLLLDLKVARGDEFRPHGTSAVVAMGRLSSAQYSLLGIPEELRITASPSRGAGVFMDADSKRPLVVPWKLGDSRYLPIEDEMWRRIPATDTTLPHAAIRMARPYLRLPPEMLVMPHDVSDVFEGPDGQPYVPISQRPDSKSLSAEVMAKIGHRLMGGPRQS